MTSLKLKLSTAAAALAIAAAPMAATAATVDQAMQNEMVRYGYDLSGADLTPAQIAELRGILESGEPSNDKARQIEQVLGDPAQMSTEPVAVEDLMSTTTLDVYNSEGELVSQRLLGYGIDIDPAQLDAREIAELRGIFGSDESSNAKQQAIEEVLDGNEMTAVSDTQMLRQQISTEMNRMGVDADVSELTDEEVVQVNAIITGTSDETERRRKIEALLEV